MVFYLGENKRETEGGGGRSERSQDTAAGLLQDSGCGAGKSDDDRIRRGKEVASGREELEIWRLMGRNLKKINLRERKGGTLRSPGTVLQAFVARIQDQSSETVGGQNPECRFMKPFLNIFKHFSTPLAAVCCDFNFSSSRDCVTSQGYRLRGGGGQIRKRGDKAGGG